MNQRLDKRRKKILSLSVALSLAMHFSALIFFPTYSAWFQPKNRTPSQTHGASWTDHLEKREKETILEEFLATAQTTPALDTIAPVAEMEPLALLSKPQLAEPPLVNPKFSSPFPVNTLLASANEVFPFVAFPLPQVQLIDLFSELPKDLIVPAELAQVDLRSLSPRSEELSHHLQQQAIKEKTFIPQTNVVALISNSLSDLNVEIPEPRLQALPKIASPQLPKLPSLEELGTCNLSDFFESELVFLPRDDKPGYVFALTLIPRPDLKLAKMRQQVTFLIDRSNSIQMERLQSTKQAVQLALEELFTDDTFNIIVFDSKVEKLFPSALPVTRETLSKADTFLDKITLGNFFSPADPYKPLLLTVPGKVDQNELHAAILITDGESLAKKTTQRSLLNFWTQQNQGKVSLYTVAMGSDHNLATLEAVSVFNKGRLSYATTNRGLKRKVLKLMKTIRTPIVKNISVKGVQRSASNQLELFPKSSSAPHLFLDQPYVIFGTVEQLDDFVLFVQGRTKDQWMNIKKSVSFVNAKKGGHTLKAEWALQKAYREYEQYVVDENPDHLTAARAILDPYNLQAAFE